MSSAPDSGHGDSHGAEAHAETPHASRAKDPKIVHESQSVIGKIKMLFWWIAGIIIVLLVMKSCKGKKEEKTSAKSQPSAQAPAPAVNQFDGRLPSTGMILMVDRSTPMADSINYQFEFDTQGDSVSVTYRKSSGETTVKYYGKGTLDLGQRSPGPVQINSLTPGKEARVRIWRVVNVYLPQP